MTRIANRTVSFAAGPPEAGVLRVMAVWLPAAPAVLTEAQWLRYESVLDSYIDALARKRGKRAPLLVLT